MNYEWIDQHLLSKKGVIKDFQVAWDATRYLINGKMICMSGGDKEGKPILTLKCEPLFGEQLRKDYKDIVPGYYSNKMHWNSVYVGGEVPDEVVREMADMSYKLIFQSLTKKKQKEILES